MPETVRQHQPEHHFGLIVEVDRRGGCGLWSNVAREFFRLPVDWFSRRQVADILSRFESVLPIGKMLAEDASATLVDGALAVLTLVPMFVYSAILSLCAITALVIYALIRMSLFRAHRTALLRRRHGAAARRQMVSQAFGRTGALSVLSPKMSAEQLIDRFPFLLTTNSADAAV